MVRPPRVPPLIYATYGVMTRHSDPASAHSVAPPRLSPALTPSAMLDTLEPSRSRVVVTSISVGIKSNNNNIIPDPES